MLYAKFCNDMPATNSVKVITIDNNYQNTNVLLVEDNAMNIKVIRLLLADCGVKNIEVAKNVKQALELISPVFDLVILDIGLPDMSGIEVCRHIRNIVSMKYIPIIACTANGDLQTECKNAGMDDFMTKPITIKDLKEMLSRNLKAKNSH